MFHFYNGINIPEMQEKKRRMQDNCWADIAERWQAVNRKPPPPKEQAKINEILLSCGFKSHRDSTRACWISIDIDH